MNEQTNNNKFNLADMFSVKEIHMDEINRLKKRNLTLDIIIAAQVGAIIVLTTILLTMVF